MNPDDTTERANTFIRYFATKHGLNPIEIAFECRMIWDNKGKAKDMSNKEKAAKRACITCC